jgi:hypothetical protein
LAQVNHGSGNLRQFRTGRTTDADHACAAFAEHGIACECEDPLPVFVSFRTGIGDAGESAIGKDGQVTALLIVVLFGACGAAGNDLADPFPHVFKP